MARRRTLEDPPATAPDVPPAPAASNAVAKFATTRKPGVRVYAPANTPARKTTLHGVAERWQEEAYAAVDAIPQVGYIVNLKANTAARGRFVGEEFAFDENTGRWDWRESQNPALLAQVAELRCEIGGQREMIRRMILHLEIAGRFYVLSLSETDTDGVPTGVRFWEPFSVIEIRIDPDRLMDPRNPSSGAGLARVQRTTIDQTTVRPMPFDLASDASRVIDCIRRSAADSTKADSPLKRLLPAVRQLTFLNMAIDGIARSRANGQMFYWPTEMAAGQVDDGEDVNEFGDGLTPGVLDDPESDSTQVDPATKLLWGHVTSAVEQPDSPAAWSPIVVRGPAQYFTQMGRIEIGGDFGKLAELRREVRDDIAEGYDAPAEKVRGMGGIAGWGAYSVDADWNQRHVIPPCEFLAEFLTRALVQPALVEDTGITWDEAAKFRITFDLGAGAGQANVAANVGTALDGGLLGSSAALRHLGFDPADAPQGDEKQRSLAESLVRKAPATLFPVFAEYLGFPPEVADIAIALAQARSANGPGGAPNPDEPGIPATPDSAPTPDGPAETPVTPDEPAPTGASIDLFVHGVAYATALTIAQKVGRLAYSRLSRLNGRRDEVATAIRQIPAEQVYATLAPEDRTALGLDTIPALTAGADWSSVGEAARQRKVDARPYIETGEGVLAALLQGWAVDASRTRIARTGR